MNMPPQTCQRPPSPPDSDKSGSLTADARISPVTRVVGGRLTRQNEYFIPREGIDSEVLAAELPLYLGSDASQRLGTYEDEGTGRLIQGYFITAYRNLTTPMLVDIKADSARREQERVECHGGTQHTTHCTAADQKVQQWRDAFTPPVGPINEA